MTGGQNNAPRNGLIDIEHINPISVLYIVPRNKQKIEINIFCLYMYPITN